MKILLTGATGYVGKRLLPALAAKGHTIVCCVRDIGRFKTPLSLQDKINVIEIDLLDKDSLSKIPEDINAAYYLIHSMSSSDDYDKLEFQSANNFRNAIDKTNCCQVIYLSGIVNEDHLSKHLASRNNVEKELNKGNYHLTTLRAGIIIGSGSASFEIIRDLVEKLPVMIAPKWLKTRCQPIAISDVITYLTESLGNEQTYSQSFDIGGTDILSYKQMLIDFAQVRKLNRKIFIVPVMTPRLSSYWLYFVTSTSYKLATALVSSMKVEVICKDTRINDIISIKNIPYKKALEMAFSRIENNEIISSWTDSFISGGLNFTISDFIHVPAHGCFIDKRQKKIENRRKTIEKIWSIGGDNGWYYADWLWKLRGFLDKMFGGVGLRRGRTNPDYVIPGDSIDFWRVLFSDKKEGRLLLFAEMKLPGEAWLEFRIKNDILFQTATFRPKGLLGRLYWFAVYPLHGIVFRGMIIRLARR